MAGRNRVTVVEVAPRDGMQSFEEVVETQKKIDLIDLLSAAGLQVIEVTGFVHPRFIPNLADAEEVMAGITRAPGTLYRGLAPNSRGARRAVDAGVDQILGLTTASEAYTTANQKMTVDQAVDQCLASFEIARANGKGFVMAVGMALWCPYQGEIDPESVLAMIDRGVAAGIGSFVLAGSTGMEGPLEVRQLFARVKDQWPQLELGYHVHNMGGMAPANIVAAVESGATLIEAAICGMGGGVASTVSSGNYPTEDLVRLLESAGWDTGLDTREVIAAARKVEALLRIKSCSHAMIYGTRDDLQTRPGAPSAPD